MWWPFREGDLAKQILTKEGHQKLLFETDLFPENSLGPLPVRTQIKRKQAGSFALGRKEWVVFLLLCCPTYCWCGLLVTFLVLGKWDRPWIYCTGFILECSIVWLLHIRTITHKNLHKHTKCGAQILSGKATVPMTKRFDIWMANMVH